MTTKTPILATIPITIDIPEQRVLELLSTGLDDPHSWMEVISLKLPKGTTRKDFEHEGKHRPSWVDGRHYDALCVLPFVTDGAIVIVDKEDEQNAEYTIDRAAIVKGLHVMSALKPNEGAHHFGNFLKEHEDAETGYVFLQMCTLGELRYG